MDGEIAEGLNLPDYGDVVEAVLVGRKETAFLLLTAIVPEAEGLVPLEAERAYPIESVARDNILIAFEFIASGDRRRAMIHYGDAVCVLAGRDIHFLGVCGEARDFVLGTGLFLLHQYELLRPALAASSQEDVVSTERGLQDWLEEAKRDSDKEDIVSLFRAIRSLEGFNPNTFSGNDPFRESGRLVGLAKEAIKITQSFIRSEFKGGPVNEDDFVRALGAFAKRADQMEPVLAKAEQIRADHPAAFGFDLAETIYLIRRDNLDGTPPPLGLVGKLKDLGFLRPKAT